jgi:hypothetical protein
MQTVTNNKFCISDLFSCFRQELALRKKKALDFRSAAMNEEEEVL